LARRERGQSIVEFALVLPVLLIIVVGMVQFALVYHAKDVATTAAQEGARMAASEGRTLADGEARTREVLEAGLGGNADGFAITAQVDGETVVVRTEAQYSLIIPWVTGRSITIEATAETHQEGFRSGP
jgi:Flp pilus assembly protein TadG